MHKRLSTLTLFAAAAMTLSGAACARDLSVISWGGAYQDAQREVYFKPFTAATKIPMTEESWDGGVGTLLLCHLKGVSISRTEEQPGAVGGNYLLFHMPEGLLVHGWKPIEQNGARRVIRCDCWRNQVGRQRLADANVPKRYQHCTIANFASSAT